MGAPTTINHEGMNFPTYICFGYWLPRGILHCRLVRLLGVQLAWLIGFASIIGWPAHAQSERFTLSGFIKDAQTGEALIGATVAVNDLRSGTVTNKYGFYSLTLPARRHTLKVSYIGYQTKTLTVQLKGNRRLDIELVPSELQLQEVKVVEKKNEFVHSVRMSTLEVPVEKLQTLPVVFGEADLLKTVQLLPGVQSGGEGFSGFYVRGGGGDQNLILLDEAVVYNPDHALGFFSTFNPDAIKSGVLYKGGIPAQYGGRISSVLDVQMREGSMRQWQIRGGIGLISSRLTIEGPIVKDKASVLAAGRRMYMDVLASPFLQGTPAEGNRYYFYDLNLKGNWQVDEKNRLYLSGYFGRDVFVFRSADFDFVINSGWGNSTFTFRWNHIFGDRLFSNVSLIYNDYIWTQSNGQKRVFEADIANRVRDAMARIDFTYYPHPDRTVRFGIHYGFHHYAPFQYRAVIYGDTFTNTGEFPKKGHDAAAYASVDWKISQRWQAEMGVRLAAFAMWGPYTDYTIDRWFEIVSKNEYAPGELVAFYPSIEPRINLKYQLTDALTLKASYNRMAQFVHRVNFSSVALPFDTWLPSSKRIHPQTADQVAGGLFGRFERIDAEWSVEGFYKYMNHQLEFRDGFAPELDRETEIDLVEGQGKSYGIEVLLQRNHGKLTGWIAYTYSRSWRYFDSLYSKVFPFAYDQPHDLAVVTEYRISSRWSLGATFVYKSGRPFTVPTQAYLFEGGLVYEYTDRNAYRMIPYHRLDIALNRYGRFRLLGRKVTSHLNLSVYNVYRRKNPFMIYFPVEGNPSAGIKVSPQMIYIFDILPSITWNFKW